MRNSFNASPGRTPAINALMNLLHIYHKARVSLNQDSMKYYGPWLYVKQQTTQYIWV